MAKPRKPSGLVTDLHLWARVAKTVEPIQKTRFSDLIAEELEGCAPLPPRPQKAKRTQNSAPAAHTENPGARTAKAVPALSDLDRRTRQKLTRGKVDVEARLDLHGLGAEEARVRLKGFLAAARLSGKRTVLVITGKGSSPYARHTLHGADHFHAPERAGKLRRLFAQWLEEPEFRLMVAGYQPAHPRHGGGGAYYVRVRRARRA